MRTVRIKMNVQCVPTIQQCTRFLMILILSSQPESNLQLCVHIWIRPFIQILKLKLTGC